MKIRTRFFNRNRRCDFKGVLNTLTELIKSAFNPINDILITCGGDSKLITEVLETKNTEIIYSPNLVMEGMIFQYKSQNKYFKPKSALYDLP